jgi:hypothetical protein
MPHRVRRKGFGGIAENSFDLAVRNFQSISVSNIPSSCSKALLWNLVAQNCKAALSAEKRDQRGSQEMRENDIKIGSFIPGKVTEFYESSSGSSYLMLFVFQSSPGS